MRQATNQVSNQVHPCDHSLLRELFQPGRDIRQVVIRARWHLLLYMNASSLFCCSFWILPFIQNKTSLTVILSSSNQNDRDCVFYPSTILILYLQKVRSPRKSTTCWLYGQSSSLPFHSHFIVLASYSFPSLVLLLVLFSLCPHSSTELMFQVVRLRGRMRRGLGRDGQVFIGELQSLDAEEGEVWSRHGRDLRISETSPG